MRWFSAATPDFKQSDKPTGTSQIVVCLLYIFNMSLFTNADIYTNLHESRNKLKKYEFVVILLECNSELSLVINV